MSVKGVAERLRGAEETRCHGKPIVDAVFEGGLSCEDFDDCFECVDVARTGLALEIDAEQSALRRRVAELESELLKAGWTAGWEYRFPEIVRKPPLPEQALKVAEEALEMQRAVLDLDFWAAAMEAMDVIHAAETLLRRLEAWHGIDLDDVRDEVVAKNRERGYYGEEAGE